MFGLAPLSIVALVIGATVWPHEVAFASFAVAVIIETVAIVIRAAGSDDGSA